MHGKGVRADDKKSHSRGKHRGEKIEPVVGHSSRTTETGHSLRGIGGGNGLPESSQARLVSVATNSTRSSAVIPRTSGGSAPSR
jgi:hypothetical protein